MKKVAIVGVEGSGKTVMLAGLGDLCTYPDKDGYFLAPKNFSTAAYVAEKMDCMRRGEWPAATAGDEMQGLDWELKRQDPGGQERPETVCGVSFLDFAGEVYRAAYGISSGDDATLKEQAESLKQYVREADDLIVLINLRDVIVSGLRDKRVQEAMWITKSILDTALVGGPGNNVPHAAIVLSQADSYAETIKACGGASGVLRKYLPLVANDYNWLDVFSVKAVDKTMLDPDGNMVPAAGFTTQGLLPILKWIRDAQKTADDMSAKGFLTGFWGRMFRRSRGAHGASESFGLGHEAGDAKTIELHGGVEMSLRWCPPGTFVMGSPETEEGREDSEIQHQVTLTRGFWLEETAVTQGQWKQLMDGQTLVDLVRKGLQDDCKYVHDGKELTMREHWGMKRGDDPKGQCGDLKDDVPICKVTWYEAVEFCRRLTRQEHAAGRVPHGYEYRLPTEAEWEYACRAGSTTALPNGRDIHILGKFNAPDLDEIAWYGGNSSVGFTGHGWDTTNWPEKQYPGGMAYARAVRSKWANDWGLYDMIGNVSEWCRDWSGPYPNGAVTDPTGPTRGSFRISRGGCWLNYAFCCRSAWRYASCPGFRDTGIGFRVALAPRL